MQKLGLVFPGQGSQAPNMLQAWMDEPLICQTINDASQIMQFDVHELLTTDKEARLNQTAYTQVALLTASYGLWRLMHARVETQGLVLSGHSLGEYTALVCAEVLTFEQALPLVFYRGQCMQEAVPTHTGLMAAILGLTPEILQDLCTQASTDTEIVSCANFNAPGQIVVAGHKGAVERLIDLARSKGAKRALPLNVSVPSHCPLMREASFKLAARFKQIDWGFPRYPVVQNVHGNIYHEVEDIKEALLAQLYSPVLWEDCVRTMEPLVDGVIECGPGRVLTGLNKRILTQAPAWPFEEGFSLLVGSEACQ